MTATLQWVHTAVCQSIRATAGSDLLGEDIAPEESLLALGFDSLRLIDLTVELEERVGLSEFPLQRWADAEAKRPEPRYTVGSLTEACSELLAGGAVPSWAK